MWDIENKRKHYTWADFIPTGELVRLLSLGKLTSGDYASQSKAAYWDGLNNDYEPVSSGLYLYTITAADFSTTRRMLIIK